MTLRRGEHLPLEPRVLQTGGTPDAALAVRLDLGVRLSFEVFPEVLDLLAGQRQADGPSVITAACSEGT